MDMDQPSNDYLKINQASWDRRTEWHVDSEFYQNESFKGGRDSLNEIELELFGDIKGKSILHLQCHFGQDTLSLARRGAEVTGVDLSGKAIEQARALSQEIDVAARFIQCDVYSLPDHLEEQFDIVFTSYGTIGWLPDIGRWAQVVAHFLKPGGHFVFAEFHPFVWMYDDDFEYVKYRYSNGDAIVEKLEGSYASGENKEEVDAISWNHGLAEVLEALIAAGVDIRRFQEYDYSPYNCLNKMIEFEKGKWRIEPFGDKVPLVYSVLGERR